MLGSGLRGAECVSLRVQDIEFENNTIHIRNGKGDKSRVTILPKMLKDQLHTQIHRVELLRQQDKLDGVDSVNIPDNRFNASSNSGITSGWLYLFPSFQLAIDPRNGAQRRHHITSRTLNRQIKIAANKCKLSKNITSHSLRHTFSSELLFAGVDIRRIQTLLGHSDPSTTQIYLHRISRDDQSTISPLDTMNLQNNLPEQKRDAT